MTVDVSKGRHTPPAYVYGKEHRLFMIVACDFFIKKPVFYFILNLLWVSVCLSLFVFLLVTAVVTLWKIPAGNLDYSIETIQDMVCFFSAIVTPLIAFFTTESREEADRIIESGVFFYEEEDAGAESIKKNFVENVRRANSLVFRFISAFILSRTLVSPAFRYFFKKDNSKYMNPYLPYRMYLPFSTETVVGYCAAFLCQALSQALMVFVVANQMGKYSSHLLQFIAQLEVLNQSLKEIEKRSMAKMKRQVQSDLRPVEFQDCLVFCLKENIQHHHAIMRLKSKIDPFIEASNSFITLDYVFLMGVAMFLLIKETSNRISIIIMLILMIVIYLLMNTLGQQVIDKSGEIVDALYTTPWYLCNKKYKTLLRLMQCNTLRPMVLNSSWFRTNMSLECFADMSSIAYKIFNLFS